MRERWSLFILAPSSFIHEQLQKPSARYHEETLALVHNHAQVGETKIPRWWVLRINDLSLIYNLPSASSRTVWADLTSFLFFDFSFLPVLSLGLLQLFNGLDLSSWNSVFVYKKDFHELASQLMSSPHMYVHRCPESSSVCAPTLD